MATSDAVLTRLEELQIDLDTRIVVEQAKGYLAARSHMRPDSAAFGVLRRDARARSIKVKAVSRDILDDRLTIDDLLADGSFARPRLRDPAPTRRRDDMARRPG